MNIEDLKRQDNIIQIIEKKLPGWKKYKMLMRGKWKAKKAIRPGCRKEESYLNLCKRKFDERYRRDAETLTKAGFEDKYGEEYRPTKEA